jgi:hypothetical protein
MDMRYVRYIQIRHCHLPLMTGLLLSIPRELCWLLKAAHSPLGHIRRHHKPPACRADGDHWTNRNNNSHNSLLLRILPCGTYVPPTLLHLQNRAYTPARLPSLLPRHPGIPSPLLGSHSSPASPPRSRSRSGTDLRSILCPGPRHAYN